MTRLLFVVAVLLTAVRPVNVVTYPVASDSCMSDGCLADHVVPAVEYDGDAF